MFTIGYPEGLFVKFGGGLIYTRGFRALTIRFILCCTIGRKLGLGCVVKITSWGGLGGAIIGASENFVMLGGATGQRQI